VYAAIFIDAIVVKVRDGQVANRPVNAAIGVSLPGERRHRGAARHRRGRPGPASPSPGSSQRVLERTGLTRIRVALAYRNIAGRATSFSRALRQVTPASIRTM
jgi:Transposase, Mutator family